MNLHPDDKLIRDLVPKIAADKGERLTVRVADDTELPRLATRKLFEEVVEFYRDQVIDELADVAEAIQLVSAICHFPLERVYDLHRGRYEPYSPASIVQCIGAAWVLQDERSPSIERFADVAEIFSVICKPGTPFAPEEVEVARQQKHIERGGFSHRLVLRLPHDRASFAP